MATASELAKKSAFIYKGEPVRVIKKEVVAVGTHSHTKLKIFVKNIFTGSESVVTLGHTDRVDIIDIKKKVGQLISKADGRIMVMDAVSFETLEAEAEPGIYNEVSEGDNVIFVEFSGKTRVLEKAV